jgi:hypothetical protein
MQTVPNLEPIMESLKVLLTTLTVGPSPVLTTVTRLWQPWEQLSELAQPAVVIVEPNETEKHRRGQQSAIEIDVQLIVYARANNQSENPPPIGALNNIIFGIRTALLPSGSGLGQNVQNLGGLVSDCYVSGKIKKDAGILDEQMTAIIPLTITVP